MSCAGRPAGEVTTYSKVIDRHECLDFKHEVREKGLDWQLLGHTKLLELPKPILVILVCTKTMDSCFLIWNKSRKVQSCLLMIRYVWRIEGMSWLVVALKKRAQSVAAAEQPFLVGDTSFECVP